MMMGEKEKTFYYGGGGRTDGLMVWGIEITTQFRFICHPGPLSLPCCCCLSSYFIENFFPFLGLIDLKAVDAGGGRREKGFSFLCVYTFCHE